MRGWLEDAAALLLLCAMCALFAIYGEVFIGSGPVHVGNMLVGG